MNFEWQEIEAIIEKYSLLKHPFYQAWQAGKLSLNDLQNYAATYYPHVAHFPRYVSAVHSNTADLKTRQMLLENLTEEEKGDENHPELWLRFAEGLGMSREAVLKAPLQAETHDCIETFQELTCSTDSIVGLAALYAYESQIPAISTTKIKGLQDFYGINDERSLAFFKAHETADQWHSQVEREAISDKIKTSGDLKKVKQATEAACLAVWKLLDGVSRNIRLDTACAL